MSEVTIKKFVQLLWETQKGVKKPENLLQYGHIKGWLEDFDEEHPENTLDKRTAARIIHQFLKVECKVNDEEEISGAAVLKDLYTCRSCANHIAQVYLKGIMDAEEEMEQQSGNTVLLFNSLRELSEGEVVQIINKVKYLLK